MKNRNGSVRSAQAVAPALVCILCLLIPGSAALSQPFPSFMLDSTIVRGPTSNSVGYTSMASGPGVTLVVWVEDYSVCGARLDSNGVLLDSTPIDIRGPEVKALINMRPAVAWGAHRFLVVWTTEGFDNGDRVEFALVEENGAVIARRVLQGNANTAQTRRAVAAFDGENFLAAWQGYDHDVFMPAAFFARISPQAVVLDSPARRVAPGATIEQNELALCFYGDRYLAAWTVWDTNGVWGSFVLPDGSTPDSDGFPIKRGIRSDYPSVTHDRHNFIVAWSEQPHKTMLARVTDEGQVLDTGGIVVDSTSLWDNALLSAGDTTLVVDMRDSLYGADGLTPAAVRFDTDLRLLDSAAIPMSWPSYGSSQDYAPGAPSVCLSGGNYAVSWYQPLRASYPWPNTAAWYRRLSRQGLLVDSAPILVSYGANQQQYPVVASDGTDFLAVWTDTRRDSTSESHFIYAARFTADGSSEPSFCLAPGYWPTVSYGGGCYLVAWKNGSSALAARVAPDGTLLDSLPVTLNGPDEVTSAPDAEYGDSVFLVVWEAASDNRIHGTRLTPSGTLLDSVPNLMQRYESSLSVYPQVAFDGQNFLVVRNDRSPSPGTFRGARVNAAGQLVDSGDISICNSSTRFDAPQLAFGGGVYLMTSTYTGVSRRISPGGSVLDSLSYYGLQAGFDGRNFVLVCQGDSNGDLGSRRMTPDGLLLDSMPMLLIRTRSFDVSTRYSSLVTNGTGVTGLVFQNSERLPWLTDRVRAATFPTLGVASKPERQLPVAFRVQPNPASRLASLSFNLTQAGPVRVSAFDAAGRRCACLFSGRMSAGRQTLPLDTRRLANGVCFLRLEAGATRHSTRLVVSR